MLEESLNKNKVSINPADSSDVFLSLISQDIVEPSGTITFDKSLKVSFLSEVYSG